MIFGLDNTVDCVHLVQDFYWITRRHTDRLTACTSISTFVPGSIVEIDVGDAPDVVRERQYVVEDCKRVVEDGGVEEIPAEEEAHDY